MDDKEVMFCPNCGTKKEQNDGFCSNCGASFNANIAVQGTPAPVTQEAKSKSESDKIIPWAVLVAVLSIALTLFVPYAGIVCAILSIVSLFFKGYRMYGIVYLATILSFIVTGVLAAIILFGACFAMIGGLASS